jgi:Domain of unknown function DUF29
MTSYKNDLVIWSFEQARLLREHRFDMLDIEHLANEIEGVAKGKLNALVLQISELLAYLLNWRYLPTERTVMKLEPRNRPGLKTCELIENRPQHRLSAGPMLSSFGRQLHLPLSVAR